MFILNHLLECDYLIWVSSLVMAFQLYNASTDASPLSKLSVEASMTMRSRPFNPWRIQLFLLQYTTTRDVNESSQANSRAETLS